MKRLPIIRHIRYYLALYRFRRKAFLLKRMGIGSGEIAPYDIHILEDIWDGWL